MKYRDLLENKNKVEAEILEVVSGLLPDEGDEAVNFAFKLGVSERLTCSDGGALGCEIGASISNRVVLIKFHMDIRDFESDLFYLSDKGRILEEIYSAKFLEGVFSTVVTYKIPVTKFEDEDIHDWDLNDLLAFIEGERSTHDDTTVRDAISGFISNHPKDDVIKWILKLVKNLDDESTLDTNMVLIDIVNFLKMRNSWPELDAIKKSLHAK